MVCFDTIPNAKMGQIVRMLEALDVLGRESDRAGLAFAMGIQEKSVTSPVLGGIALGFVRANGKNVTITEIGVKFLGADSERRKEIIGQFLSEREPIATLLRALDRGPLAREDLMRYIKAKMPAARTWSVSTEIELLKVIRNWCEFGNLMEYEPDTDTYSRL